MQLGWLLGGVLLTVATGVVDDLRGFSPLPKLGLLTAAAALAGGFGLAGVTNPFTGAYVPFGALGGLATLLWIVAVTNAFNLVCGLNPSSQFGCECICRCPKPQGLARALV